MIFVDSGGKGVTVVTELSRAMTEATGRDPWLGGDLNAIVRAKAMPPLCAPGEILGAKEGSRP